MSRRQRLFGRWYFRDLPGEFRELRRVLIKSAGEEGKKRRAHDAKRWARTVRPMIDEGCLFYFMLRELGLRPVIWMK
jgi:hypothetical protein